MPFPSMGLKAEGTRLQAEEALTGQLAWLEAGRRQDPRKGSWTFLGSQRVAAESG